MSVKLAGRTLYPSLHKPAAFANDVPEKRKYQLKLLIDKQDPCINALRSAIKEIMDGAAKGKKNLAMPIVDGDDEEQSPDYAGCYVISAKTQRPPGIVNQRNELLTDPDSIERLIQSGDYIRITANPYYYDVSGNRGIALGLNNVQFVSKGDPIAGGRPSATSEFEPIEVDGVDTDGFGSGLREEEDAEIPF